VIEKRKPATSQPSATVAPALAFILRYLEPAFREQERKAA
jgi:hypothetical protein